MSKLEAANNPADGDDEEDEEAKQEASKYKICMWLVFAICSWLLFLICFHREKGIPCENERSL